MMDETRQQPRPRWRALLFPEPERRVPGERQLRTILRTYHRDSLAWAAAESRWYVSTEAGSLPGTESGRSSPLRQYVASAVFHRWRCSSTSGEQVL